MTTTMPSNENTILKRLFPLYLVIFAGFVGYSLMITVFTPLFISGHHPIVPKNISLSGRTILLGFILFLYPLGQFFSSSILGAFSDRFGRKPILIFSLLVTTICYAVTALCMQYGLLSLLIIALLIAGLAEGNIVLAQSSITDLATPQKRNQYFGYIFLSASTAYILGPFFGGKLTDSDLVYWFSEAIPFWTVALLLFIIFLWIFFSFKETSEKKEHIHYFEAFTNLKNIFFDKRVRTIYWINFFLYLGIFGFFRCYPMYLVDEFQMNVSRLSEFIAWVAVPIIIANLWLTGFLSQRFTPFSITWVSAILTAVFMFLVVMSTKMNSLWITLFLTSLALALCLPSCASILSNSVKGPEQGRIMGNNQSLQVGAEALSGLIGGLLASIFIKLSLIVLAIIIFLAALALLIKKPSSKKQTDPDFNS